MDERTATDDPEGERPVSFDMDIEDGQTRIVVDGDRDTAVVVRSASGEKIYLPPEDFERPPENRRPEQDSPYQASRSTSSSDSPYQTGTDADSGKYSASTGTESSPYQTADEPPSVTGIEPTADGYVIVHPEPVSDVRFLR